MSEKLEDATDKKDLILGKFSRDYIIHFLSYVLVGGIATIVEWVFYYLFDVRMHIETHYAVALAFVISTFANWLAGRLLTYKNVEGMDLKKEILSIYGAAVIGLVLNEIIMYVILHFIFIDANGLQKMIAKVVATGIVFFWNFFIRDLVIYKDKGKKK